jgi:hypothetical protein
MSSSCPASNTTTVAGCSSVSDRCRSSSGPLQQPHARPKALAGGEGVREDLVCLWGGKLFLRGLPPRARGRGFFIVREAHQILRSFKSTCGASRDEDDKTFHGRGSIEQGSANGASLPRGVERGKHEEAGHERRGEPRRAGARSLSRHGCDAVQERSKTMRNGWARECGWSPLSPCCVGRFLIHGKDTWKAVDDEDVNSYVRPPGDDKLFPKKSLVGQVCGI